YLDLSGGRDSAIFFMDESLYQLAKPEPYTDYQMCGPLKPECSPATVVQYIRDYFRKATSGHGYGHAILSLPHLLAVHLPERGMRSSSRCRCWIRGRPCSARSVLRPTPSGRAMRWKKSLKLPGRPTRERNRRGRSPMRGLRPSMARTSGFWRAWTVFGLGLGLLMTTLVRPAEAAPPPLHSREHAITIDATALNPPTRWHVPGVTPIIWSMDPDYTEALRTTEPRELRLKPGMYRCGTFTFDLPFKVT